MLVMHIVRHVGTMAEALD